MKRYGWKHARWGTDEVWVLERGGTWRLYREAGCGGRAVEKRHAQRDIDDGLEEAEMGRVIEHKEVNDAVPWWDRFPEKWEYDLLAAISLVHGEVAGLSDDLHPRELEKVVEILKARKYNWDESTGPTRRYDACVHELLCIVLEEYKCSWQSKVNGKANASR